MFTSSIAWFRLAGVLVAACLGAWGISPALAQTAPQQGQTAQTQPSEKQGQNEKGKSAAKEDKEEEHKPADPDTGKSTLSPETLGLLPNPLQRQGVKFTLTYIGETLANPTGGLRRGLIYDGRLNGAVDLDFGKLAKLSGLNMHANFFQIHGHGLSREYIGNLMLVSSIEALATIRLYEAWLEQKLWNDKVSVRAGQLAADTEFITSKYTDVFINSSFGWPAIAAVNLPSGGPSPPLAAIGARVKAEVSESLTLLAAIFNGDPAGPGVDDPQTRNRYGINFRVNDPPLLIGEAQYAYNQQKNAKGLPGTFKLGGWYHAGLFNDQRLASNGLSQADPNAAPTPAQLRSDFGIYSVFEQMLLRFPGDDDKRGIGAFGRVSTSPSDRNLIDFYADGGVNIAGPFEARGNDKIALGFGFARISDRARALDLDYQVLAHSTRPVRDYEALLALSYLAEIRPGWTLHPSFQYIVHPGGGYVMDNGTAKAVGNAAVFGVRTVVKF